MPKFVKINPKMFYKLNALILLCFLVLMHNPLHADSLSVNYFTPKNVYSFAEYLFQEGDYLRAAGEFQRYLYGLGSFPAGADSVLYKIGLCYQLGKDFAKAIDYFRRVVDNYPQSTYIARSCYQIAYSYFLMGKYRKSISYLDSVLPLLELNHDKLKMQQLIGLNYIYQRQWKKAYNFLYSLDEDTKNDSLTILLMSFARKGEHLQHKNKLVAGFLSSVIPGTGKVYCGRSSDGLFSLIVVGLMGWQAYESFHKDGIHSVKGWIYGTIGGIFYLGNIYGSIVAAKIYNEQQEDKLLDKVGFYINVYLR
ncbi:MAG TPA: tetratricopeptide repeat protein [bacterium (Candidatus Stahlbacteria)]|nr:tetratricopeptide repeat protein [Candidatus Stahlbacteria bacterium]